MAQELPRAGPHVEPALRHLRGILFDLDEDYPITWRGHTLTAHAGYRYDVASVPRALWPFISPFDLTSAAALAHDLLYSLNGRPGAACVPLRNFTRLEADQVLRDVARDRGVPVWRYQAAYVAVRVAGGRAWRRHGRRLAGAHGLLEESPAASPLLSRLWLSWISRGRHLAAA